MALQTRPPVVTILGHVDHGKTTLLDFIRKTAVASKEYGGITQAIGAYQVTHNSQLVTFIDTPGHAAFEKMRSRGAQVADIAVLVVALDDGLMPQTIEAIKHIQSAHVSMIVAVNKIDLPGIDLKVQLERIKKQLADQKVMIEEYGGDVPLVKVSAKTGQGVPELLETIILVAEVHELKGDPQTLTSGVVIESKIDKFKGPIATILVRNGTLKKGDQIIVGGVKAKVRGMFSFDGKSLDSALPSTPVEVLGFESVPMVGAKLGEESQTAQEIKKEVISIIDRLKQGESQVLNVVIKADKEGSLEAITTALEDFNKEKQQIKILSAGTGDVADSDVESAISSKAIVIGFNVAVKPSALKFANTENILIRTYQIIYELLDEIKEVIEGIIKPGKVEEVFGKAQIIAEFPFGKGERIAGCKVAEGTISKGPRIRIVRNEQVIGETKIKSLKKLKEEVSKVEKGTECGMMFEPIIDFQTGDIVESFRLL